MEDTYENEEIPPGAAAADNYGNEENASSAAIAADVAGGLSSFLTRHFSIDPLPPTYNNVGAALITVVYVKAVMEVGLLIRVKYGHAELSRKFIHIMACSMLMFWPLFDASNWGWRLNVTVPVVMTFRLFYKGAILKDPEDEDVRSMSRTSSPSELLYGPIQMTAVMCYVGLREFMSPVGVLIMASFVGDWMAAFVGLQYGRYKYRVPFGGEKSIEGTIGAVVGTIGGICFYSYALGMEIMDWQQLLAYGCISSLAEATSLDNWDNVVLAVAMDVSAKHLPTIMSL